MISHGPVVSSSAYLSDDGEGLMGIEIESYGRSRQLLGRRTAVTGAAWNQVPLEIVICGLYSLIRHHEHTGSERLVCKAGKRIRGIALAFYVTMSGEIGLVTGLAIVEDDTAFVPDL